MVRKTPRWRANCAVGHPKQRQFKLNCFVLDFRGASLLFSKVILYFVITNCKGPITRLDYIFRGDDVEGLIAMIMMIFRTYVNDIKTDITTQASRVVTAAESTAEKGIKKT